MNPQIFVIAPDRSSGQAFNAVLTNKGLTTYLYYVTIAPRVVHNTINTHPKVQRDIRDAILFGYHLGFTHMVIACNTAQFWYQKAMDLLPSHIKEHIHMITSFDTLKHVYPDPSHRPLLLGTTVTVRIIRDFPTLLSLGFPDLQDLVQEIIWRVKGVTGSDVTTASNALTDLANIELLKAKTRFLVDQLITHHQSEVILACTELPIAMTAYLDADRKSRLSTIDPADFIADVLLRTSAHDVQSNHADHL